MRRSRATLLLVAAGLASLGAQLPWQREPASFQVEVLKGFATAAPAATAPGTVELLLDARASMDAVTADEGPRRWDAAWSGAERFLAALPGDTGLGIHVLGADENTCGPARELARTEPGAARAALGESASGLAPEGGGSLARALETLAERGGVSHVVAFTDLGADCEGDLCAAARRLAASGAQLDLVVVGEADTPGCIRRIDAGFSGVADEPAVVVPPRFEVFADEAGEGAESLASGWVGGDPVSLDAAPVHVAIALDPPVRIGPIGLVEGRLTRLQVIEFPGLAPRVREWGWNTEAPPAASESP